MKWEYRTVIISPDIMMHKRMNELGLLHWEMIGITSNDRMIFKRPVEDAFGTPYVQDEKKR